MAAAAALSDDPAQSLTMFMVVVGISAIIVPVAWILDLAGKQSSYHKMIDDWCQHRALRLVTMERCWFWTGPFFLSSRSAAVFYVTVCNASGKEKHLWMRCGHWILGMLRPELTVQEAD